MIEQLQRIPGVTIRAGIVEPSTAEAASAVLMKCSENRWPVQLTGAGTNMSFSMHASNARVHVTAAALKHVADYKPEDLTITVGAGTRLNELQDLLSRSGQWLALDPPALPDATIGGLVATAASGPLRAKYGTPRDHVLGLQIVTGDGRVLDFGGRVVKNVAGYDMVRPIVGSLGSLGLITRVSLRLRPLPAADRTCEITLQNDAEAIEAVAVAQAISDAWPVAALEILKSGTPAGAANGFRILVRIHGHPDEVAEGATRVTAAAAAAASSRTTSPEVKTLDKQEAAATWQSIAEAEATAPHVIRLAALPSRLADVAKIANRCSDLIFGGRAQIAMHATAGVVRIWGDPVSREKLDDMAGEMDHLDGTLRASRAFGWHRPPAGRKAQINDQITALFDPAGILPRYGA